MSKFESSAAVNLPEAPKKPSLRLIKGGKAEKPVLKKTEAWSPEEEKNAIGVEGWEKEVVGIEHTTKEIAPDPLVDLSEKVKVLRRWKFKKDALEEDVQARQKIRVKLEKQKPSKKVPLPARYLPGSLEAPSAKDLAKEADASLQEILSPLDTTSFDAEQARQMRALEKEYKQLFVEKMQWEKAQKEKPIELGEEDLEVLEEREEEKPTLRKAA